MAVPLPRFPIANSQPRATSTPPTCSPRRDTHRDGQDCWGLGQVGTQGSLPAKSELTQEVAEVRPSHPPAGRPPCPQRPHSQHPGNQTQKLCLARTWADMEGAGISRFKLAQRYLWGGDSWPGRTDHTKQGQGSLPGPQAPEAKWEEP